MNRSIFSEIINASRNFLLPFDKEKLERFKGHFSCKFALSHIPVNSWSREHEI
ncbi:MAG: hypothetical protein ABSF48_09605 [Thermodesulfobacteriota bacterium]